MRLNWSGFVFELLVVLNELKTWFTLKLDTQSSIGIIFILFLVFTNFNFPVKKKRFKLIKMPMTLDINGLSIA